MGWRRGIAVYLAFLGLVSLATFPLILQPASLWPPHHDPRVFTWVMASMAKRLLAAPLALFHGNAFYPHGNSLTFTEPLLLPALLGLPGFIGVGNPILTYNLLLLLLWPLAGLAMTWTALRLTGQWAAACLAGFIFCLSPYYTEYYLEFQMLMTFPIPLAVLGWARFLEGQEGRWLAWALGWFALEALTSWYYGIILALYLAGVTLCYVLLRWRGWRWRTGGLFAVGMAALALVLAPVAAAYWDSYRELGFRRTLSEAVRHSADLASLVEPGRHSLLYRWAPARHITETSLFPGFTALALAAATLGWSPAGALGGDRLVRFATRAVSAAIGLVLLGLAVFLARGETVLRAGPLELSLTRPGVQLNQLLLLGGIGLALQGWRAARQGVARRLREWEWVGCLLLLGLGFYALALGPSIHYLREEVGRGSYLTFFNVLFPLHAIRVTTRFGIMVVFSLALLAAFGLTAITGALPHRPWARRGFVAAVFAALALEYAVAPLPYEPVTWAPRPVDRLLKKDTDDVAVLEWPLNVQRPDAEAMFQSLWHDKRLVNGLSGFVPPLTRQLSELLSRPATPFPHEDARALLRSIYPLRYLVVRPALLRPDDARRWGELLEHPTKLLQPRGRVGQDLLFEVHPLPEVGTRITRLVSYEYLLRHRRLHVSLQPLVHDPRRAQAVEALFNDRPILSVPLVSATEFVHQLPPPDFRARPNRVDLIYTYNLFPPPREDPRYAIGRTGARALVDIEVVSAARPYSPASSIRINSREYSRRHRGYNLVAFDETGRVLGAGSFDTFLERGESGRLARWIAALPPRALVAASVHDEASGKLTEEAVRAIQSIGGTGDLRGHAFWSHIVVGQKGAPPGTALELIGARRLEATVGQPAKGLGLEVTAFSFEDVGR